MILNKSDFDIKRLKLIIWDLDNTFWDGVISEGGGLLIDSYINLVKDLSSRGIVNSICSKNDFETCMDRLKQFDIWEYFVFPSIDWTAKAQRVHGIIKDMGLRPANVLFLDDEPYNLHAASSIDDSLMCGTIQDLFDVIKEQLDKIPPKDGLKRLKQYRDLQLKVSARKEYDSDEEFLKKSEISVSFIYNCKDYVDRITELIERTNQLNFTKNRISKSEVEDLISKSNYKCACISVSDKFCDYGITGFYALNCDNNCLDHFLFSCRTIGMGIEQFVYASLKYPALVIKGDVVTTLKQDYQPDWISITDIKKKEPLITSSSNRILVKGPCDVSQVLPFFKNKNVFDTEFSYTSVLKPGTYIESMNHSSQIIMLKDIDENIKKELIKTIPFIDGDYFKSNIFSQEYDYVIISLLTDYSLGLYQNIEHPSIIIPFSQYTIDYTKEENWNEIMHEQTTNSDEQIASDYKFFKANYKYIGRISPEQMLANYEMIRKLLPKSTKLILLNGAERAFIGKEKNGYEDRFLLHRFLNPQVHEFVMKHQDNTFLIDVNSLFGKDYPYLDTINHYKKNIYYKIAQSIEEYIAKHENTHEFSTRSRYAVFYDKLKELYVRFKWRILVMLGRIKNNEK